MFSLIKVNYDTKKLFELLKQKYKSKARFWKLFYTITPKNPDDIFEISDAMHEIIEKHSFKVHICYHGQSIMLW